MYFTAHLLHKSDKCTNILCVKHPSAYAVADTRAEKARAAVRVRARCVREQSVCVCCVCYFVQHSAVVIC
jgi:hypothetical protein